MALYEKMVGAVEGEKILVHQFIGAVAERSRGVLDRDDIITIFHLDAGDLQELDDILDKNDSLTSDRQEAFGHMIHDCLMLSESGLWYTANEDFYTRVANFV